jgi:hypothetical protein
MSTIRFYGEFRDELGTDWRINLHDTDFVGTTYEITLGGEGFQLRYTGDSENRFQPVIGSSVTFSVLNDGGQFETFLNTVFPAAEEGRMQVEIRKDPDGLNTLYWAGIIAAEQIEQEDAPAPNIVNITASDDIANLKETRFIPPAVPYPLRATVIQIFNQMRTTSLWGNSAAFLRYVNDVEMEDYTGTDWFKDVTTYNLMVTNDSKIYDGARGHNSFEILESLALSLNARVFQAAGHWWFLPVNCHLRASEGDNWTSDLKQVNLSGNAVTLTTGEVSELSAEYVTEIDDDFTKMAGGTISNLPPYKSVRRVRRYDGNDYIFSDYTTGITTGDNVTFSDTDRTYIQNLQFTLGGSCQILLPAQSYENNPFNNAVVQVQMTIQCGTLYYTNAGWTSTPGERTQGIANFQRGEGLDAALTWGVTTDELPSQQEGIDITIQIRIIQIGVDVTSDYTSTGQMILISHLNLQDDQGLLGDGLLYEAQTSLNNKLVSDQGEALHGDPQATISGVNFQVLYGAFIIDGLDNQYTSSQTTTAVPLHRLGVEEAMAAAQFPIPIKRGQIYGRLFEMWQTIKEGTEYFAPFCFDVVMNARQSNVQRWQLDFDATNITSNELILENDNDTLQTSMLATNVVEGVGTVSEQVRQLRAGELSSFSDVRTISNRSGSNNYILQHDTHIFNNWIGGNGSGNLYLPLVANSEGRTIQIHSDATIAANKFVKLLPNVTDTSATIDGATSYNFDRAYDGITILCHNSNWYIIQKKEK